MEALRVQDREADLVRRAKLGESAAHTEIFETLYPKIYSYIYYRVSDVHTAEDLAADVFVRLVKSIDRYEYRGKPLLAYLYTIAGNIVRDHHRKSSRVQHMPLDDRELISDDDPAWDTELSLTGDRLKLAISQLTDEQAQVIIHKFIEQKSNGEIAQLMGKREGSIKSLQHRALNSLRRILVALDNDSTGSKADDND